MAFLFLVLLVILAPAVERALEGSAELLKESGLLCMTVPYTLDIKKRAAILKLGGGLILVNRKKDGSLEVRDRPLFRRQPTSEFENGGSLVLMSRV